MTSFFELFTSLLNQLFLISFVVLLTMTVWYTQLLNKLPKHQTSSTSDSWLVNSAALFQKRAPAFSLAFLPVCI